MSAITTTGTTTGTRASLKKRPSPMKQLARTETKLFLRERIGPVWGLGLPLIMLVVFGSLESQTIIDGKPLMDLYVPVVILMGAAMICLISSTGVLTSYRERGVLRRFHTTPAGAARLLAAQVIVNATMVLIMAALILIVARVKYSVPLPSQFGGFILTLGLAIMALLGIGGCIASVAKTSRVAQGIGALCFYPMMFFSGLWLPIPKMSPVLQDISHATPLGSAVTAMSDTLSGTFPPVGYLGILAGWAIVTGLLAQRLFRWE